MKLPEMEDLNENQRKIIFRLQEYARVIEFCELHDYSQIARELNYKVTALLGLYALETWKGGQPAWPDFLREPPPPMVAPCPSFDLPAPKASGAKAKARRRRSPVE